ncbi:hypothetical protein E4U61_005886 [Claviceps capensis]|nr:hypothetical protein E4U61_005886 [Claviceps capensis]
MLPLLPAFGTRTLLRTVTAAVARRIPRVPFFRTAPSPRTITSTSLAAHRRVSPNISSQAGFDRIDESVKVEKETLPFYEEGLFYPARIGEVIRDQYQVIAKLGYGASSTTWLTLDLLPQGSHGSHIVFVLPPLGVSVKLLQELQPGGVYEEYHTGSASERTVLALEISTP